MRNHKWVKLNTDVKPFIVNKLGIGGTYLSEYFLNEISKKIGTLGVYCLIWDDRNIEVINEIQDGGVVNCDLRYETLAGYIKNNTSLFIFDNYTYEKGYPCLDDLSIPIYYMNKEVYFICNNLDSKRTIEETIREASEYPFICYRMNKSFSARFKNNTSEFTEDEMSEFAKNADEIIMGAYDEESFLRIVLNRKFKE
jgi:hypothetical protein